MDVPVFARRYQGTILSHGADIVAGRNSYRADSPLFPEQL
jgi:hypothetical protein